MTGYGGQGWEEPDNRQHVRTPLHIQRYKLELVNQATEYLEEKQNTPIVGTFAHLTSEA